jgi:hypothetical protein
MHLSDVEEDLLGDLAQDSHELWEVYTFVRLHNPRMSDDEVVAYGRKLVATWLNRCWLEAVKSRDDRSPLTAIAVLATVDALGKGALDPYRATTLFNLSRQAFEDVPWLSRSYIPPA